MSRASDSGDGLASFKISQPAARELVYSTELSGAQRIRPDVRCFRRTSQSCREAAGTKAAQGGRNRQRTSNPSWTPVPALVFPQCSLGVGSTKSSDERTLAHSTAISLRRCDPDLWS